VGVLDSSLDDVERWIVHERAQCATMTITSSCALWTDGRRR
jgi:hypothetical protein